MKLKVESCVPPPVLDTELTMPMYSGWLDDTVLFNAETIITSPCFIPSSYPSEK